MKEISSAPIAQGRTAEIYVWDNHQILKLYRAWCPPVWVEHEARIARAVYEAGIPSPKAGEIVEANSRRGLLYQHLDGVSMLQDMNTRPWNLFKHARLLAELQAKIHQESIPGLPSYKDRLHDDIGKAPQLTDDWRRGVFALLEALPDRQNVCHGDYHPGNVLLTQTGPVVIDWMTACSGSPWADVARTSLILSIGAKAAGKQVSPVLRMMIRLYQRAYMDRYHVLRPDMENERKRWMPVIAAARLNENITVERDALIRTVKEGLV
ncbi:MAG TPA: aminoglycoside phosphotransferase family protein [Anaerolineales bacterium]|nr:aminoglycoside phosphotransferase family protein [Anaerolineales bacterium]